ncbi:MAG: hypothetical protein V4620_07845 [Bacteroidota bacterium]
MTEPMAKVDSIEQLKQRIALLTIQQANDERLLKEQFKTSFEALKPVNLIKNTFRELSQEPDFKDDLLSAAMGIASGYISKKLAVGNSHNPIKQVLGMLLQVAITSLVSKNADGIKSTIMLLIKKLTSKKETSE